MGRQLSFKNKNSVKQKFQFYAIYYSLNKFTINQFDILRNPNSICSMVVTL